MRYIVICFTHNSLLQFPGKKSLGSLHGVNWWRLWQKKVRGDNPALAEIIARDHLGTRGNHIICSSLLPINV